MSDFLNTPTAGDRWRFPVLSAAQPLRSTPLAETAAPVATEHRTAASAIVSDALQNGGRLDPVLLIDRLAGALAERDAAAASLDASNQAIIAGLTGVICGLEDTLAETDTLAARLLDYIGILRVAAGLPALRTDEELAAVIAAALKVEAAP